MPNQLEEHERYTVNTLAYKLRNKQPARCIMDGPFPVDHACLPLRDSTVFIQFYSTMMHCGNVWVSQLSLTLSLWPQMPAQFQLLTAFFGLFSTHMGKHLTHHKLPSSQQRPPPNTPDSNYQLAIELCWSLIRAYAFCSMLEQGLENPALIPSHFMGIAIPRMQRGGPSKK